MAGYATRVRQDIDRWVETGLIDPGTRRRLFADLDAHSRARFSFGTVLALMAAALFAAAILIFVAANWEAIPRLGRVAMLFALILAGYGGGAMLKLRGQGGFGEACWLVAAAAFGAAIALIGQMYHLSGDERQAVLVWCLATTMAAAALRSSVLTAGAVLLAAVWMLMAAGESWWSPGLLVFYLPLALGLYLLSFWTRSWLSRVLLLLSLNLFIFVVHVNGAGWLDAPILLAILSACAFAAGHVFPRQTDAILRLGDGLLPLALLGFLSGVGLVQLEMAGEAGFLPATIAAFAGVVVALLVAGRENRRLRQLCYAAFLFQLGFIYVVMLGTMLDTAGFFVAGGLALSLLAWLIARVESRFEPAQPRETDR